METPLRVLIVEDVEDDAFLLLDELEMGGYLTDWERVATVETMQDALERRIWDVIVADYAMPRFNGLEALRLVQRMELDVPFIIVSGTIGEDVAVEAMRAGAHDYIMKNNLARLGPAIARELREAQERHHRRKAEQELKKQKEILQTIFDRIPVMISYTGPDGTMEMTNREMERVLGWSMEELKAINLLAETFPNAAQRKRMRKYMASAPAGWKDFKTRVRDGRTLDTSWAFVHLSDGSSIGIGQDITERKRVERELIEAKEKAEEMSRLRSAFLTNMSHEIRTPLSAIIGFASILVGEISSEYREYATLIERSGKRLLDTLNSVLELSMLEAGSFQLHRQVINLNDEIAERIAMLQPLARDKGIALKLNASGTVTAFIDKACLDRILNNLVGNALKFTDRGSVTVEIGQTDQHILLNVCDTGIGISDTFLPHLFDDFKQESTGLARSYEGTGLGLAITKRLVELLDGTIEVETQRGAGTTFRIVFPHVLPPPTLPRRTWTPLPESRRMLLNKAHILVLDDDPAMRLLLTRQLRAAYELDVVADQESAFHLLKTHRYDVILLDINLGNGPSGLDLLPTIRETTGHENVPIIAITAYALSKDRERFLSAGFDEYISKPFTPDQLLDVVESVMAH